MSNNYWTQPFLLVMYGVIACIPVAIALAHNRGERRRAFFTHSGIILAACLIGFFGGHYN